MAMATATAQPPAQSQAAITAEALAGTDVMKRAIKRVLPCTLTEQEFMQIAKMRVDKEALHDQVVEDFDKIKAKHKASLEELDGEIGKMRKELHTGEQDRTVLCVEVFHRANDGTGWVHTLRMDALAAAYAAARADAMSHAEAAGLAKERATVERRPATPTEAQRHLPDLDGAAVDRSAPLLDQAAAAQGGAPTADAGDEDEGVPEDDGLGELTPAQQSAREAAKARKARRAAGKKRGGKDKA